MFHMRSRYAYSWGDAATAAITNYHGFDYEHYHEMKAATTAITTATYYYHLLLLSTTYHYDDNDE